MSYIIVKMSVVIDGEVPQIFDMGLLGKYDPNKVKNSAIRMLKEKYPNSRIAPVILNYKQVTYEEYQQVKGSNPQWLGNSD
ncbi:hypothetical protein GWA97_09600 [Flavobacterium sp. LaA7.5]|nr:hypothetical protein [Flavobacterium salilacus subsp. altitudinum]